MKERLQWLDALRGTAIIFVVMGHVVAWNMSDISILTLPLNSNDGLLWNIIYSFHMPLFFFISSYLFYQTGIEYDFRGFKIFFKKKIQRLLIPYITTGFIIYYIKGHYGYWFLLTLFEFSIVSYIGLLISQKIKFAIPFIKDAGIFFILYVLFVAMNAIPFLFFLNLERFLFLYPFFVLGIFIRKYSCLDVLIRNEFSYVVSLLLYIGLFCIHITIDYSNDFLQYYNFLRGGLRFVILIFMPFFMIVFLYNLFQRLPENVNNLLSYIGKKTLDIYIFHIIFVIQSPVILSSFQGLFENNSIVIVQLIYSLIISIIAIVFSLIMGFIVRQSSQLSLYLLGK